MIINVSEQLDSKMEKEIACLSFEDNNNNNYSKSCEIKEFCKLMDDCCQADKTDINLTNFLSFNDLKDSLHKQCEQKATICTNHVCYNGAMTSSDSNKLQRSPEEVAIEAKRLLDQFYASRNECGSEMHKNRLLEILKSIQKTGTYDLTFEELEFGARTAYRNSSFIADRWQWTSLKVFDCRHVATVQDMFDAICKQLRYVTNGGAVRNAVTIFPNNASFRIWNPKLISYAGYQQEDGSVIGDPAQLKLTQLCESIGWTSVSGRQGAFDVLPLLLNVPGEDPKCFEIPKELLLQIDIEHPQYKWFAELGVKWYAIDTVANMAADIGGLRFSCAPYGGALLSAEVATRDLCDPYRYNILEEVAFRMGLDTTSIVNLWKDQACVEINIAVVNSFKMNNIWILDHHTASDLFVQHLIHEHKQRGGSPANWTSIVPPISSGLTKVFHQEMLLYKITPCFEKQSDAWKSHVWVNDAIIKKQIAHKTSMKSAANAISLASYYMNKCLQRRVKTTIVYASETGKSEMFARRLGQLFQRAFNYEVIAMDEYKLDRLPNEEVLLVVTSTFGSGDAPQNGKIFSQYLAKADSELINKCNSKMNKVPRFAVFALGSSAYPDFCGFGKFCDDSLKKLGFSRLLQMSTGDEIKSQEKSFKSWANEIFQVCCNAFEIRFNNGDDHLANDEEELAIESMKIASASQPKNGHDLANGLSEVHQKNVTLCRMISRTQLQSPNSDRQTILVRLDTSNSSVRYQPGDHLGVFPSNPKDHVRSICKRLKQLNDHNNTEEAAQKQVVSVRVVDRENLKEGRVQTWTDAGRIPPCTIWTALTNYLDITTPPTQAFLKRLSEAADNDSERLAIDKLVQNDELYEEWKSANYPSLADVLEEFPSVSLDLRVVLTQLPLLQPRYYSISSSPQLHPSEVQLTVAVVTYKLQGKPRRGVCSNYLNDFPTTSVPCFVRSVANFRLPKDNGTPVIMVGPGTGIAPFRSFWQQRKHNVEADPAPEVVGRMTLYFGCRAPGVDDIYSKELQSLRAQRYNFLSKIAYSRSVNKPKTYVQHLLDVDADDVYAHLTERKGHFYVCGEAAMAADVRNTLKSILKNNGQLNSDEALKFLNKLKDEGRFQEDIFGVMVKSS